MTDERCVLQDWVVECCTWKQQTVLLCALRGTDSAGTPTVKSLTRWLRRTVLKNAAPNKTFMQDEGLPLVAVLEEQPQSFDMLSVHFFGHLMHAFEVVGYCHPNPRVSNAATHWYHAMCNYLHIEPEPYNVFKDRLRDEV